MQDWFIYTTDDVLLNPSMALTSADPEQTGPNQARSRRSLVTCPALAVGTARPESVRFAAVAPASRGAGSAAIRAGAEGR
jgi:hypothetical protein